MTIRTRFRILLALLLSCFAGTFIVLLQMGVSTREETAAARRRVNSSLVRYWGKELERRQGSLADDLAQSPTLARLTSPGEPATADTAMATDLARAGADFLWILPIAAGPPTRLVPRGSPLPRQDLPDAVLAHLRSQPTTHGFIDLDGQLVELTSRRMTTRDTHLVVVARTWNESFLSSLGTLVGGEIVLRNAGPRSERAAGTREGPIEIPLPGLQQETVRVAAFTFARPEPDASDGETPAPALLFVAFGSLLVCGVGLAVHRWMLGPLGEIRRSLAEGNGTAVAGLCAKPDEWGEVARLVVASHGQHDSLRNEIEERKRTERALQQSQEELKRSIDERARVGRDLHDGVIQTLYAAGMGLAAIKRQLYPEQTDVLTRLEQTRAMLNDTIHDVRNSIMGLEPQALKTQSFGGAVIGLLETMRSLGSFHSAVVIDDAIADRLTLLQRVHALQIAREAVSNAMRHGKATMIEISLDLQPSSIDFVIRDNGYGFDAPSLRSQGKGLANFSQRAREIGADMIVESRIGQGTRVALRFPLPS